jgi:hypothetical protein
MKLLKYSFFILLYFLIAGCENDNIEHKYYKNSRPDNDTSTNIIPDGEIAWFPLNGNTNDSTGRKAAFFVGNPLFVNGLNQNKGKGLHLDGNSYLLINLGYYDSLSVVLWVKGDGVISDLNKPVLFDYGYKAISAQLEMDAISGATILESNRNEDITSSENSSVEYLNSFNKYSFLYFEAGAKCTRIKYKGFTSDGSEILYNENLNFDAPISAKSEFLFIGRSSLRDDDNQSYFKGAIEEIHIYNRPLTSSEIETLANTLTE